MDWGICRTAPRLREGCSGGRKYSGKLPSVNPFNPSFFEAEIALFVQRSLDLRARSIRLEKGLSTLIFRVPSTPVFSDLGCQGP